MVSTGEEELRARQGGVKQADPGRKLSPKEERVLPKIRVRGHVVEVGTTDSEPLPRKLPGTEGRGKHTRLLLRPPSLLPGTSSG